MLFLGENTGAHGTDDLYKNGSSITYCGTNWVFTYIFESHFVSDYVIGFFLVFIVAYGAAVGAAAGGALVGYCDWVGAGGDGDGGAFYVFWQSGGVVGGRNAND